MGRQLLSRAWPGAAVVAVGVVLASSPGLAVRVTPWLRPVNLGLLALLGVLSLLFRRSRLLHGTVLLALAEAAVAGPGSGVWEPGSLAAFTRDAVAVLLPLNVALLACWRERPVLSEAGVVRLLLVVVQAGLAAYVWATYQPGVVRALGSGLPLSLAGLTTLPLAAAVAYLLAGGVVLVRAVRTRGPVEVGLLWLLVATAVALDGRLVEPPGRLLLVCAGTALAVALLQALFAMAFLDTLTGLPARRAFDEALLAAGRRYAVAIVDIDHFKACNDTHGHDVGDQVLRMVASRLREVGGGGHTFRYGGEEFAIVFPGKTAAQALPHLEALRAAVEASSFTVRAPDRPARRPEQPTARAAGSATLSVTVSAGVAGCESGERPPLEVLKAADEALYRAKRGGRNRVCGPVAGPLPAELEKHRRGRPTRP